MFAIQKPESSPHQSQFYDTKPLPFHSEKERKQDTNFNILEETYDKNDNFRHDKRDEMADERDTVKSDEEQIPFEDNRTKMKKMAMAQMKVTRSEGISLSSSEEEVRSPPEGAEIMQFGRDTLPKETTQVCNEWPGSPLEDNGYASSSLSIDSPDSIPGSTWDETKGPELVYTKEEDAEMENSEDESSDSESLTLTLTEAFQSMQDKEKLKEQEKEKHYAQLTMYRRLALLRWIRSLQQRVKDQQNRLQESFDTILDNRKEILRYIQHGCNNSPTKETA